MSNFYKFRLTTGRIAIGERIKKETFRPCVETLPSSTVEGCFKDYFGLSEVYGIGFFKRESYLKDIFIYSPADNVLNASKLPISLEYLKPNTYEGYHEVEAEIYILVDDFTKALKDQNEFKIRIGALKSKGFGESTLIFEKEIQPQIKCGLLKGRLKENEKEKFGIEKVVKPVLGYLFQPTSRVSGYYVRSLFEGSIIKGYDFLIEEEYLYENY